MAVFSTILDDDIILEKAIKPYVKNILLVVCGGCSNESLAYIKKLPVFVSANGKSLIESLADWTAIPYASKSEAERIAKLLEKHGYSVETRLVPLGEDILCIRNELHKGFLQNARPDIIMAICCPAGIVGIKQEIADIPIVALMKPHGQLYYKYHDSENTRVIIYDQSMIV